ncbi:MAG TPA: uroporphyrinogen decarboxylase family protein [Bacteroidales bacterium]|nr:uroporphyrinogen decarboxylase family protein [Bacteroidales bacterium]
MKNIFTPDYTNLLSVLENRRPKRLPIYEHHIDPPFISKALGEKIDPAGLKGDELVDYYRKVIGFWKEMTYDGFDFEAAICDILPGHGAILGGMAGPIQTRDDFNKYPWNEIPEIFKRTYTPHFEAIRECLPAGMKAFGGCGYGIFEASQDLVGFEYLCVMQCMDPDLFRDLFIRIGDLWVELWSWVIENYHDLFVFNRMGDDLGHKTSTMLDPDIIRQHIFPQYKRVIDLVHASGKRFLLHSCGCIFPLMDEIIELGIDAKHSNEDQIAPFMEWIEKYSSRIGLFGGFDLNLIILNTPDEVYSNVLEMGTLYRNKANGYGLGSGNSIPAYIPVDGFLAMIEAIKEIRRCEI